jgi:hypothetical protein
MAACVVSAALGTAGCGMDHADRQVIDRLLDLDMMDVPSGGVTLATTTEKGGGADLAGIRNPSTVTLVWASPLDPTDVGLQVHGSFDDDWLLRDDPSRSARRWSADGSLRADPGTFAVLDAREPVAADHAPPGSRSVVTVRLSAVREK